MDDRGTCYLLHFDAPLSHARHYLGWAKDVDKRVAKHRSGTSGARLMSALFYAGIGFQVARTWPGDRRRERQLKRQGSRRRLCPVCNPGMKLVPLGYPVRRQDA